MHIIGFFSAYTQRIRKFLNMLPPPHLYSFHFKSALLQEKRKMQMLENICIAFINVLCAEILGPVAGLLLPCKKVPHSRVVKEVQQNHLTSHPFLRHTHRHHFIQQYAV